MANIILYFVIFGAVSMMAASGFVEAAGITFGWGALFLVVLGLVLYFLNIALIRYYIQKNARGVLELDELYGRPMEDGDYLWEKTAGIGMVPKWVSGIGIWSYASFVGAVVWVIIWIK